MSYEKDLKPPIDFDNGPPRTTSVASSAPSEVEVDAEGERRVRRAIEEAAPRNTSLLNDIESTEEAVQSLQNNEVRLCHTKEELSVQDVAVQRASHTSISKQLKYTRQRDSLTRKWYYILTRMRDNFEQKVREAEKDYHEALAAQQQAESRQRDLQRDMDTVEKENSGLLEVAKKHMAAHKAVDDLYASLFDGPTPGFPDEDEREQRFKSAKTEHDATTKTLTGMAKASKQTQALKSVLEKAQAENNRAEYEIDSAFFVSDYAQIFIERCARVLGRAEKLHHELIENLPKPLDRNLIVTHQAFGRLLTSAHRTAASTQSAVYPSRREMNDFIINIANDLRAALDGQSKLAKIVDGYQSTAKQAVKITSRALEDSRQALQEIRQGAFEVTVGFGAAAPAYHECCDRAEEFENDAFAQWDRILVPTVDDDTLPPPPSYERAVQ